MEDDDDSTSERWRWTTKARAATRVIDVNRTTKVTKGGT